MEGEVEVEGGGKINERVKLEQENEWGGTRKMSDLGGFELSMNN